jgi:hypothetical protein
MDKAIIIAIISSGALSTIISTVFSAWQTRKKRKDGVHEGVKILLYDRIKHLGKGYIQRGYITAEELEDLTTMHTIYHEPNYMNGNGFLDAIMKNVKNLPIK